MRYIRQFPRKIRTEPEALVFAGINTDSRSMYSHDARVNTIHFPDLASSIFSIEGIWVYTKNEAPPMFN